MIKRIIMASNHFPEVSWRNVGTRMKAIVLDGLAMSKVIHIEITQEVNLMKEKYGLVPGLAIVRVGDDPASAVYVRNKCLAAEKAGMSVYEYELPLKTSHDEVKHMVDNLNIRTDLHGIIIQFPLPKQIREDELMESIDIHKDVDGLHPANVGLLMSGKPNLIPATPLAIQQLLLRSGYDPESKHVVVCGRSKIVGKPIAALLMQKLDGSNATVTVCPRECSPQHAWECAYLSSSSELHSGPQPLTPIFV